MRVTTLISWDMESGEILEHQSYEYEGPVDQCGGGASSAQKTLESEEANFYQTLTQDYSTVFGEQQQSWNALKTAITPILNAGPNQQGFNAAELSNLNTTAIDSVGGNYQNAQRAVNNQLAGRGGNSGLQSGVDQQISSTIGTEAAGNLSNEELGITQANYATGLANYNNAVGAMEGLSGQQGPGGYASNANNANTAAFNEATQIQEANNAWEDQLVGGITGVASGGLKAITGGVGGFGGGSALGQANANANAYASEPEGDDFIGI